MLAVTAVLKIPVPTSLESDLGMRVCFGWRLMDRNGFEWAKVSKKGPCMRIVPFALHYIVRVVYCCIIIVQFIRVLGF